MFRNLPAFFVSFRNDIRYKDSEAERKNFII